MIEFCQSYYEEKGKVPTSRLLNKRKDCRGAGWVKTHFGGVPELLAEAGLPAPKKPSSFVKDLYKKKKAKTEKQKKEVIIEFAQELREKLGRKLVSDDFRTREENDRPSLRTIQRLFGDVNDFWKAANLDSSRRRNNLSDEDMKEYLKEIRIDSGNDCWITDKYNLTENGYRWFPWKKEESKIHRVSHKLFKGDIPKELVVTHSCHNRECYNPEHLFLGTMGVNIQDVVDKGERESQTNRSGGLCRKYLPRDPYDKNQMEKFLKHNTQRVQPFNQLIFKGDLPNGRYPEVTIRGQRYTLPKLILAQKLDMKYEDIEGVTRHILPDGSKPDHRDCNPDHLFLGSQSDNVRDSLSYRKNVKLSEQDWEDIGRSYEKEANLSQRGSQIKWQRKISQKYNITINHALRIGKIMCKSESPDSPESILKDIDFLKSVNIEEYSVDYLIPKENIAIDFISDLVSGAESSDKKNSYYQDKSQALRNAGYSYYCFRKDEIENSGHIIRSMILFKLGQRRKIYARKCKLRRVGNRTANAFFENNHLMGKGSGECFALLEGNSVISAIRIIKRQNYIDVSRFATKCGLQVLGGLSRLLKHVERLYSPNRIVSFVDARYGNGNSLKNIGFVEETNFPSFQWTDGIETFHRRKFLGNSGYENNCKKIWDCGQIRFAKYPNSQQILPTKEKRKSYRARNKFERDLIEVFKGDEDKIKNRLIEIGLEIYQKLGRKPQSRDFRGDPEIPTDAIISKYFKGVTNFIEACGINKLEEERLKQEFIDHAKSLANQLGRSPMAKDFKGKFSYSKLRTLFENSLNNLLKLANLKITRKS